MRYRVTVYQDYGYRGRGVLSRAFYRAEDPQEAVMLFDGDFGGYIPDTLSDPDEERDGRYGQALRWPADQGDYFEVEPWPEQEREHLGRCAKCAAPADYRFTWTDRNGTNLTLQLCSKCNKPKASKGIVGQAFNLSGCKKRSRRWWLKVS